MRSETGHVGANLAVWGGVIALLAMVMAALPEGVEIRWWVWVAGVAWLVLWAVAILNLSDGASRGFVAGTLRKSTYTQIYTTLTRRNVMGVWRRVCDPADDRDPVPTLFRAALTWRLYDAALLIAVAYPIALPVAQWIVTGEAARIGGAVLAEPAAFWWERAGVLSGLLVLILGISVGRKKAHNSYEKVRQAAKWIPAASTAAAITISFFALTFGSADAARTFLFMAVFVVISVPSLAASIVNGAPAAIASSLCLAMAGGAAWIAVVDRISIGGLLGPSPILIAPMMGVVVTVILLAGIVSRLDAQGRPLIARLGLTIGVVAAITLSASMIDWTVVPNHVRSIFLFLGVLPLLNALFDTASYAVTLTFLRRGLRARLPLLWGLADLAVACVLFLALGATLVAAVHGLNWLAGVPLVDLGALFAGVYTAPGGYVWLYLMLFSTLLPTALHFAVSLLGLQGVLPRAWRRPVAGWIAGADAAPRTAVIAALALGLVWWLPLALLGAALWALWTLGGSAVRAALSAYLDGLLWIAQVPVGAL